MNLDLTQEQKLIQDTARDFARAELELRKRQVKAVDIFRKYVPGCEKAFIARTSPSLNIRRGRLITCDYDVTHEDVIEARHFDDEVYVYGERTEKVPGFHFMDTYFIVTPKDGKSLLKASTYGKIKKPLGYLLGPLVKMKLKGEMKNYFKRLDNFVLNLLIH